MLSVDAQLIIEDVKKIQNNKPLVHNITNYVTAGWIANGLLALGAAPVMAHAPEEVEELVDVAQALVLNIGTLDELSVRSMKLALKKAGERKIPVVLDPVGAGATAYRTRIAHELLVMGGISVVRGNPSEICALTGGKASTLGVETTLLPHEACESAHRLQKEFGCVVVASGPDDIVQGPEQVIRIYNGTAIMAKLTGMGCLVSSIIAVFCTVQPNPTLAAAHAMAYVCIVGERAAVQSSAGLGSYQTAYLDLLGRLPDEWIFKLLTVESHALRA